MSAASRFPTGAAGGAARCDSSELRAAGGTRPGLRMRFDEGLL